MFHGPSHYSERWKFLNNFCSRYDASRHFTESSHEPTITTEYCKNQEVDAMTHHAMYYILQEILKGN